MTEELWWLWRAVGLTTQGMALCFMVLVIWAYRFSPKRDYVIAMGIGVIAEVMVVIVELAHSFYEPLESFDIHAPIVGIYLAVFFCWMLWAVKHKKFDPGKKD